MVTLRHVAGGVLVVVLVAAGLGAAFYYGIGPAPGGTASGAELTEFPTATPSNGGGGSDDGGSATTPTEMSPFSFTIDNIEECGQTCRDVTATLSNNQDDPATNVTVFTRVYAGKDNTAQEDLVWEGKEEVGTVEVDG